MRQLGLEEKNLIKTDTVIRAANEAQLEVLGLIPVTVQVVGHPDKKSIQHLYITKQLKTLFLFRTCLLQLGCLPKSWPYPSPKAETYSPLLTENLAPCGWPARSETLTVPTKAPFPITDTVDHYRSSTFNTCPHEILPGMTGQELTQAIKPGATLTCDTIPHRVPIHWKQQIEEGLQRDINMGIIYEVPENTPAKW